MGNSLRMGFAGPSAKGGSIDVNEHISEFFRDTQFGGYRLELQWMGMGQDGRGAPVRFDSARSAVERILNDGCVPAGLMLQLTTTPPWARPANAPKGTSFAGDGPFVFPANPDDYGNYVLAVVNEFYPDGIRVVELWNEPNIFYWKAGGQNPAQWARMVVSAYRKVKAVHPDVKIITGGISNHGNVQYDALQYLKSAAAAVPEFINSFDGLGYHPYGLSSRDWRTKVMKSVWRDESGNNLRFKTVLLHNWLTEKGKGNVRIWLTETGLEHHPWAVTGKGLLHRVTKNAQGKIVGWHEPLPPGTPVTNNTGWNDSCASEEEAYNLLREGFRYWNGIDLTTNNPVHRSWKGAGTHDDKRPGWKYRQSSATANGGKGSQDGQVMTGPWYFYRWIDYDSGSTAPAMPGQINRYKGYYMNGGSTPGQHEVLKTKNNRDVVTALRTLDLSKVPNGPPVRP